MSQVRKHATAKPDHDGWRFRLHEIIFEADTLAGKSFDVGLIICIGLSVLVIMLDSVEAIHQRYSGALYAAEWFFTVIFTVEYVLRLLVVHRPLGYAASFYGLVDLLAIIPTYLSLLLPGSQYLLVIRALRVLRIFRVLKLARFLTEAQQLGQALQSSRRKIFIFLLTVLTIVTICGSVMYVVEGGGSGFTSIPKSVYWAIVTLTTVGYGDISPQTNLGQTIAAMIMILGYAIIAVPTGIITAEIAFSSKGNNKVSTQACPDCCAEGHDVDAVFCKYCGEAL
jgi:voltage-gated potassium channel